MYDSGQLIFMALENKHCGIHFHQWQLHLRLRRGGHWTAWCVASSRVEILHPVWQTANDRASALREAGGLQFSQVSPPLKQPFRESAFCFPPMRWGVYLAGHVDGLMAREVQSWTTSTIRLIPPANEVLTEYWTRSSRPHVKLYVYVLCGWSFSSTGRHRGLVRSAPTCR